MILRRLALAVLAFPLVACSEPTVSDRGVEVTLTVDRTVLRPGETAQVSVAATNRGARSVTINSGGCPAAFVVLDQRGTLIRPGPQVCAAILTTRALGPGESYVFRHAWRVEGASGTASAPQPLRAGTYVLRGRVGGQYLRAESSPVEVRVEAPAPGQ
jgi:hypothetical protein